MTFIQAIILGIIQGITEFIPVSSSGHLVIIPFLLGWELNQIYIFAFNVLVQIGTLSAVLFYYRSDLVEIGQSILEGIKNKRPFENAAARTGWLALLAAIPAGAIGLAIRNQIKSAFNNPATIPYFLLVTGALLMLAEFVGKRNKGLEKINPYDAVWIGVFQILSLFPGISRSGSTIAGGMTRNLTRKASGQFSFLMAIPILAAAGVIGIIELLRIPELTSFLPVLVTGVVTSSIVGYFAISWLLGYLNNHSLLPFAVYSLSLAATVFLFSSFAPIQLFQMGSINRPSETTYQIAVDPELEWMMTVLNNCSDEGQGADILILQAKWDENVFKEKDLYISFGDVADISEDVFLIGFDYIVPVVHPQNPLLSIPIELFADIYSGKITSWGQIKQTCESCFSSDPQDPDNPFQLWIFPEASATGKKVLKEWLNGTNFTTFAAISPSSKTMRQAVSLDENSAGFLPAGWVDARVKEIQIMKPAENYARLPIIAVSPTEPPANLKSWIVCVQTSFSGE